LKKGTAIQFTTLILLIVLGYFYKSELYLGVLYAYSFTGSPHAERLIGEHYNYKSYRLAKKSAIHLQKALYRYKMALPIAPREQKKWIEYIIGTHYHCGRGVNENMLAARQWYQNAADKGALSGKAMLDMMNQALEKIEQNVPSE